MSRTLCAFIVFLFFGCAEFNSAAGNDSPKDELLYIGVFFVNIYEEKVAIIFSEKDTDEGPVVKVDNDNSSGGINLHFPNAVMKTGANGRTNLRGSSFLIDSITVSSDSKSVLITPAHKVQFIVYRRPNIVIVKITSFYNNKTSYTLNAR